MKIAVLASGGVDSSVALCQLAETGYEVEAFYLKIWLEDELAFLGECPWQEDLNHVQAICKKLDIPLHVIPLQKEYWDEVVHYTLKEVQAGRTPNPDMLCNQRIKFGAFLKQIDNTYDKVATGHYARVEMVEGIAYLKTAKDAVKDQTYFLAQLSQAQLSRVLFPLGDFTKDEVREQARAYQLPNAQRKDSQGICFLGKFKFSEFLKQHLGERPGDLIEFETGKKLGVHPGYWYFTIGQRKGIGLSGGPWFVVEKDIPKNQVFVSNHYHEPEKRRDQLKVIDLHWLSGFLPREESIHKLRVKLRHGEGFYQADVQFKNSEATLALDESDQGIAAGQFAVFYQGDICLGSGVIG